MASFTDTQIRNMVENYRKKLGIRTKIEVVILPLTKYDGLGHKGKIWINSKRLNDARYSDDAVRRLVVHEMVHSMNYSS